MGEGGGTDYCITFLWGGRKYYIILQWGGALMIKIDYIGRGGGGEKKKKKI